MTMGEGVGEAPPYARRGPRHSSAVLRRGSGATTRTVEEWRLGSASSASMLSAGAITVGVGSPPRPPPVARAAAYATVAGRAGPGGPRPPPPSAPLPGARPAAQSARIVRHRGSVHGELLSRDRAHTAGGLLFAAGAGAGSGAGLGGGLGGCGGVSTAAASALLRGSEDSSSVCSDYTVTSTLSRKRSRVQMERAGAAPLTGSPLRSQVADRSGALAGPSAAPAPSCSAPSSYLSLLGAEREEPASATRRMDGISAGMHTLSVQAPGAACAASLAGAAAGPLAPPAPGSSIALSPAHLHSISSAAPGSVVGPAGAAGWHSLAASGAPRAAKAAPKPAAGGKAVRHPGGLPPGLGGISAPTAVKPSPAGSLGGCSR
jgi:hypothetical protein